MANDEIDAYVNGKASSGLSNAEERYIADRFARKGKKAAESEPVGFLGYLPGGIGKGIETGRAATLSKIAAPIRAAGRSLEGPLTTRPGGVGMGGIAGAAPQFTDPLARRGEKERPMGGASVLANFLTGIPGALASMGAEFAASELEQAPETLALGGVGRGAKALGVVPKSRELLEKIAPALFHRGGMAPKSKAAFEAMDLAKNRTRGEAAEMRRALEVAPSGQKFAGEERKLLGQLLEQPGQREAIKAGQVTALPTRESLNAVRAMNGQPTPVNWAKAAREVPGVTKGRQAAAQFFPESDLPAQTFEQVASKIAKRLNKDLKDVARVLEKAPQEVSRMTEFNYSPRRYMNARMGTFPQTPLRERTAFMSKRRDLTDAQRMQKGLTETGQAVEWSHIQSQDLVATRNLFTRLAANPNVSRAAMTAEEAMLSAGQRVPGTSWVKLPDDKNLGPLAGTLMRKSEAAEVTRIVSKDGLSTWRKWVGKWKFGKTVLSPKTHVQNFSSNILMAHAEGLSPYRLDIYGKAANELRGGKGQFWNEAKQAGASWAQRIPKTLEDQVDLSFTQGDVPHRSIYEAFLTKLPDWVQPGEGLRQKGVAWMAQGYQDSEALFKHALYISKRERGVPIIQAIRDADQAMLNYANMPQWVKQVRSMGIVPFISFTYGVTPRIAKTIAERPDLIYHYKIAVDTWNRLAKQQIGMTDDESMGVDAAYPTGGMMVMPWRDEQGSALTYGVWRLTPASEATTLPSPTDAGGVARYAGLKNPLVSEGAAQMTGVDPFTQSPFFVKSEPGARMGANDPKARGIGEKERRLLFDLPGSEENKARALHLLSAIAPDLLGGRGSQNIASALRGVTNIYGEKRPVGRTLLEAVTGRATALDPVRRRNLLALERQGGVPEQVLSKIARERGEEAAKKKLRAYTPKKKRK